MVIIIGVFPAPMYIDSLAVHGSWTPWGSWGSCSASCDGGNMTRDRSCSSPRPQYGGRECDGENINVEKCADINCPSKYKYIKILLTRSIYEIYDNTYIHIKG